MQSSSLGTNEGLGKQLRQKHSDGAVQSLRASKPAVATFNLCCFGQLMFLKEVSSNCRKQMIATLTLQWASGVLQKQIPEYRFHVIKFEKVHNVTRLKATDFRLRDNTKLAQEREPCVGLGGVAFGPPDTS